MSCFFAHLLVCVSQAGLELASGSTDFSMLHVVEKLCTGWVFGVLEFCFLVFFFCQCGSSVPARFLIYRAHTVCFLLLLAILDPSIVLLKICSSASSMLISFLSCPCHSVVPTSLPVVQTGFYRVLYIMSSLPDHCLPLHHPGTNVFH
jgi:hypothetical protein